jgi:hypothetical protein
VRQKWVSIFTSTVFILFHLGCTGLHQIHTSKEEIGTVMSWEDSTIKKARILEVITKTGASIDFSEERPGKIIGDRIRTTQIVKKEVEIDRADIERTERKTYESSSGKRSAYEVTTRGGETFVFYSIKNLEDKIVGEIFARYVSIPLSEVESVWVQVEEINAQSFFFSTTMNYGIGILVLLAIGLGFVVFS